MLSIQRIILIIFLGVLSYYLLKYFLKPKYVLKKRASKPLKKILSAKTKAKAEHKYRKLLAEFKKKNKRNPLKDELFRIVIAASHHTFPVKGRNSRRWMRGKKGHWNRQKVRKYLLEKYNIVDEYKMR